MLMYSQIATLPQDSGSHYILSELVYSHMIKTHTQCMIKLKVSPQAQHRDHEMKINRCHDYPFLIGSVY